MLHTSADSLLSSLSLQPSQSTNAWFACSDIPALKTRIELTTCNYMKPSMASTVSMIVYRCIHNECCGTISFEIYASEQPYDVMVMLSYDHPVQHHDSPRRLPQPELATKLAAQEEAQPTTESPPAVVESKVTEVVQIDLEPQAPVGDSLAPSAGIKLCTRCQRFEVSLTHKTCVRGTGCRINERRRLPPRPSKKADAIEVEPQFATDDPDLASLPPPSTSASLSSPTSWTEETANLDTETSTQLKDDSAITPQDDYVLQLSNPVVVERPAEANATFAGAGHLNGMEEQIPQHRFVPFIPVEGEHHPAYRQPKALTLDRISSSPRPSTPELINEYLADDVPAFSSSPLTSASSSPAATPPPEITLTQSAPEVWDPSQDSDMSGMRICGGTKCTVQVPANGRFKKCDDCREKFRLYQIARRQKQKKPNPKPKHPKVSTSVTDQAEGHPDVPSEILFEMMEFAKPLLRTGKRKHGQLSDSEGSDDEEEHTSRRVRLAGGEESADEYVDDNENDGDWQE